ncbi:MAG: bifunctional metallophosphatase/5'-nucleotidase, partial [Traorella sp.]
MKIKIYATSDVHGTITPYRYSDQKEMKMGMMKLSFFIKKDSYTLLIDNGDVLQGSPLDAYYQIEHHDIHPMA